MENTNYINSLERALEILEGRNNAGFDIDMGDYIALCLEVEEEEERETV
jgi:hypothetical protein